MKALLVVALLLVAAAAGALTVSKTENRLTDVRIYIVKQAGDPSLHVSYRTYQDDELMRDVAGQNYWDELNASQKQQIRNITDGIYNKLHQQNQIPTPSPTPVATPEPTAVTKEG